MRTVSRRQFVKSTALVAAALQLPVLRAREGVAVEAGPDDVELSWLEGVPPIPSGVTWGVPWPRGKWKSDTVFRIDSSHGRRVPSQSWPLAYWPDGSLKWTAHAAYFAGEPDAKYRLSAGPSEGPPTSMVVVDETAEQIRIDTGSLRAEVAKQGSVIFSSLSRGSTELARAGTLVCLRQDRSEFEGKGILKQQVFHGRIEKAVIEQRGPIRAVVRLEGRHVAVDGDRAWLPFTLRLYFYAGSEQVRMVHSFVYDGNQADDFISGLGVTFDVPLRDELYNRHVRFAGETDGVWGESVRNFSGLRPNFRRDSLDLIGKQFSGEAIALNGPLRDVAEEVPAWDGYKLFQSSADHFDVVKRTNAQSSWLQAGHGRRALGFCYVGGGSGGVAFGLSDFWQRHPTALEIEGMTREVAKVTLWLWSPDAPPMDVRHYDTRGHSLNATYEDHEEGHSTPLGVARTSELTLALLANTPSREQFAKSAQAHQQRPLLVCAPSYYHNLRAFGLWSLPDRGTPAKARLEEELDQAVAFYQKETEQRQWFGFWNYGDFMHSYDRVRHTWRYDVGGFAWANSELVPDLWLWYFFLRSGRADVFKMAEAMTRHTGEVDVHHIGPFAGLGSRHNVSHWGCGSKEARISQAGLRRMFFYLTADERVGDLMRAEVDSDFATVATDPLRKILPKSVYPTHARVGPDWFSFVSNWLVEWERTGDVRYRDKIITGMKCIAAMPRGLFTGAAFGYDPKTSKLFMLDDKVPGDSHLVSIFGGAELCFELAALIDEPEWDRAWLQYCELYNVPGSDRARTLGGDGGGKNGSFSEWHARLTAYVGWRRKDLRLVRRAWEEFFKGQGQSDDQRYPLKPKRVQGPDVLLPIDEISWISTNEISQWSLNAIELLELAGDVLPA